MASGSFNLAKSSGDSYIVGMIKWSSTPNTSGNYSSVKATLYVRKDNDNTILTISTAGTWSYSLTINGNAISGTISKSVLTDWVEIASHTISKINHDADGGKTITIKGSVTGPAGTSMEGRVTSGSKSVALDTIPRASSITATNANIGSKTTISISRAASSFTHTLTYAFEGLTGTIATKTTGTSIQWTVPTSFYAKIPNDPSGKCTITCDTYSGSTKIGTATATFTATAAKSVSAPTVSVVAVDTNTDIIALTGSNKRIVKGFSDVKVTTTATAKNSASISSVAVTCGTAKKTGTSVTFTDAESATIEAIATDSRGYSTSATASGLTLVNYIVPTIVETISRESPTSDTVNISVKGKWFNGNFGAVANTLRVQVKYKPKSQSAYADSDKFVDMEVKPSGNAYTATLSISGLDYTQAYSIRIRASDAIHVYDGPLAEPIYRNTEISKGLPVFDWGEDDFQFNVPVKMPENRYHLENGENGLDMKNSDIVNINALFTADEATSAKEGLCFYRDGTNWDAIWIRRGVVYFCPNYPENTTNYALSLGPGSEVSLGSQSAAFPGFITDSTKRLTFTIPLNKPVLGVESVAITGDVVGRGIAGYIVGTGASGAAISMDAPSGYTVECAVTIAGISVVVQFDDTIPYATNNTPVTVAPYGTITIKFS